MWMKEYLNWLDNMKCDMAYLDRDGRILCCSGGFEQVLGAGRMSLADRFLAETPVCDAGTELHYTAEWVRVQVIKQKNYIVHYIPIETKQGAMIGLVILTSAGDLIRNCGGVGQLVPQELQSIFDVAYDGLFITDGQGHILMVNSAWEALSGFSRRDVLGRRAGELVMEGKYSRSVAERVLESGQTETILLEITSGSRANQRILATGVPIFDTNGAVWRVVANIRDVAVLNEIKTRLEERNFPITEERLALLNEKGSERPQPAGPTVIIKSEAMRRTMDMVARVAGTDATVLLTGETGVGKEVVARALYSMSSRSKKPYIQLNCAAIPGTLLESELFGYAPGAFTGANRGGKIGLIELADGGTLLLDEIGELPLDMQAKILRALQSKEFFKVGASKATVSDVRIIAATNRDLKHMVADNQFRADLFFRLSVMSIHIPPLRERREEIPHLVRHFLAVFNQKHGRGAVIEAQALELLLRYDWPGNVRELENQMERLVILADGVITAELLPWEHLQIASAQTQSTGLKQSLEELESQILRQAADIYKSSRKMARALGISQSTVIRKMKQYQIAEEQPARQWKN